MTKKPVYLACPYTHPSAEIRRSRFDAVTRAAAVLIKQGQVVYSPITMTHPIDVVLAGDAATLGSQFWVQFDESFMSFCSEMVILRLEGWQMSSGIKREIDYFKSRSLPIRFIDPDGSIIPNVPLLP